jgi:hypothetical protein
VTGPVHIDMLLHRDGAQLVQADGAGFDFRGAKDCCNSEPGEPNPKWPIGSPERWDWLRAQGNVNMVGMRLGPWRTGPNGEIEFAILGGGYAERGGKADLSAWNEIFWTTIDTLLLEAAKRGIWVEVGVIDGWALKADCHAGDIPGYQPWAQAGNLQGAAHCSASTIDATQEAWVRKVVAVTGRHGNVVYETSNESSLVPSFAPAWEEQMIAIIHEEERAHGYPRHLVASNAQRSVPSADWNEWHTGAGPVAPSQDGKITGVSEYNPEPPLTGTVLAANYCAARVTGVYYWLWRHGMTLAEWVKALNLMKVGCADVVACPHPDFEDPRSKLVNSAPGGPAVNAVIALGAAVERVRAQEPEWFVGNCVAGGGTPAGDSAVHAAERWDFYDKVVGAIVAEMRKGGTCAWQQRRVEIHSLRSDKLWSEMHTLSTGNGCLLGPTAYKNTWSIP